MSWSQRKKTVYIFSILSVLVIIIGIILFFLFYKEESCSDGIKNQDENGVDCGGSCNILCKADYVNPVVLWGPRWQKVLSNGTYNFLTYIQNPNIGVGAYNVSYLFKVYDKDNILLYQKTGSTYVPPNNNFVVFETNISLNDKVPARTKFEFTSVPSWEKIESNESSVTAVSKKILDEDTKPKVVATLNNNTLNEIDNIESVAILYDENDNAIAFSKTITDSIAKSSTADIVFTWPEKFTQKVVRIDIISEVLPQ